MKEVQPSFRVEWYKSCTPSFKLRQKERENSPKRYIEEEIFKRRWGRGNKAAGHCISAPSAEEQIRIFQIWSFVIVQSVTALTSIAASIFIRISTLLHIRMISSNMTGSNWQRL